MIQSSRAIVLKQRKSGESDIIADVLLESGEKISVYMFGIRASKNRSTLISEPGCLIDLVFYRNERNVCSLKEATVLNRFEQSKNGYEALKDLSFYLQLFSIAIKGEPSADFYPLLQGCLHTLDTDRHPLLKSFIFVRLCKIMGYLGEQFCIECGKDISESQSLTWNTPDISFICSDCRPGSSADAWAARSIDILSRKKFSRSIEIFQADQAMQRARPDLEMRLRQCLENILPDFLS